MLPPIGQLSRSGPTRRRSGVLTGVAAVAGLLVLALGGAAAYLALSPPVGLITQEVIAQVKARTGRDFTVAGPIQLSLFPRAVLSAGDVTLSTSPGMTGEPLATMAGIEIQLKLLPLLWKRIEIDGVRLQKPVITLSTDAAGHRSWDFAGYDVRPVRYADAGRAAPSGDAAATLKDFMENASDPANPSPQAKARLQRLDQLRLGDLTIEDGTVRYFDARSGVKREATAVAASVGFASLASPVLSRGSLTYAGQALAFDVKLSSVKALIEDRAAKLIAAVSGKPGEISYDGTVTTRAAVELDGTLDAKVPSFKAAAHWLGQTVPATSDGFGPLTLQGKLKTGEGTFALSDAKFALDDQSVTGLVGVDTSGARPRITANLRFSALDLNRYLPDAGGEPVQGAKAPEVRPATGGNEAPVNGAAPASIEDLIKDGAAKVKGYTRRAGWSSERIPLDVLALADVDARLSTGRLRYHDIETGTASANVTLKGRQLRINFDEVQLYEGRGRGFIQVDGAAAVPVVGVNLGLEGVQLAGLLKDAADFEMLKGKARLSLAIGSQGTSQAELVSTANGKVDLSVSEGALVGYNIPGGLRGLAKGNLNGFGRSASEKTDFSEMAASFSVTNGVASSQDIRLVSPMIAVTGSGQVMLPQQQVDLVLKPKLTASLDGSGGKDAFTGVEVPLKVQGPWAQPTIHPDGSVILKDPAKAVEAAQAVAKQLKENGTAKKIGDALKGLVNKQQGDGTSGGVDTSKAKDFLNKLFNKN